MNAPSPRSLLAKYGLRPKQSWGQNFLYDEDVLAEIAGAALLTEGDPCVELGPGLGHLTRALLATGAKVTAVERDRDMVKVLNGEMPTLKVVSADAANVNFAEIAGAPDVTVVGNLPYHLSSPILFEVLDQSDSVKRAVFTLQREVVTRLAAPPGGREYGILSVMLGLRYDVEDVMELNRNLFHPPPNVDSAVVRLTRRKTPRAEVQSERRFRKLVKAGFAQRRKTLLNSLKSDKSLGEPEVLVAALLSAGIDGIRRAETLSVEEFAALERALPPPA